MNYCMYEIVINFMSAFINKLFFEHFFNSSPTSNQDLDSLSKLSNDAGPSTDAKTSTSGEPKIPMSTKSILKLPQASGQN